MRFAVIDWCRIWLGELWPSVIFACERGLVEYLVSGDWWRFSLLVPWVGERWLLRFFGQDVSVLAAQFLVNCASFVGGWMCSFTKGTFCWEVWRFRAGGRTVIWHTWGDTLKRIECGHSFGNFGTVELVVFYRVRLFVYSYAASLPVADYQILISNIVFIYSSTFTIQRNQIKF